MCSKHRARNEVDAGRDRATPARARHDDDQPLTLSLRATVPEDRQLKVVAEAQAVLGPCEDFRHSLWAQSCDICTHMYTYI